MRAMMRIGMATAALVAACSGAPPVAETRRPSEDPETVVDEYDGHVDEFGNPVFLEDELLGPDAYVSHPREGKNTERFSRRTPKPEASVDKGAMSMLMGWGIQGNLHFQDGQCTEADCQLQPDHCSFFGLICDSAWHIQAKTLDFNGEQKLLASLTGACADDPDAWYPCIFPKIGASGNARKLKWKLDMSTCPQTNTYSAQRTAMINGWQSVRTQTSTTTGNPVIGLGITWQETTGNDWDIFVTCKHFPAGDVQGEWVTADTQIALKYALAVNGGPNRWVEDCQSSGLPGYNANPVLRNVGIQQHDMAYQYDRSILYIDMETMASTANNCTTDVTRRMYSYHNVLLHELGHHWGLVHDRLANLDFQVMKSDTTCAEGTNRAFALHPFYREAIRSLDTTTTSANLTVFDDDISCFIPDEY